MIVNQSLSLRLAAGLAFGLPAALLGGALISQYVFGLYPCEMCYWQRWPHWAALLFAGLALALAGRMQSVGKGLIGLAAVAIAISGLIGGFHAGVEYGWWKGLTTCAAGLPGGSTDDVLGSIMNTPLVRCDAPQWTWNGISLAGFNFLLSVGGAVAIFALLRSRPEKEA